MAQNALFGNEARKKIMEAVDYVANAVKVTLGPKGRTVMLNSPFKLLPIVTKDGVTVARHINDSEDPFKAAAIHLIRESASSAAENAGDGTTTATVLAQAIVTSGYKMVIAGANPTHLIRGMNLALQEISARLSKMAIPIEGKERIRQVADIASNGDALLSSLFGEAVDVCGNPQNVLIGRATETRSSVEMVNGMTLDKGYVHHGFSNGTKRLQCQLENPYVFVFRGRLPSFNQVLPLLGKVKESGRPILIFSMGIDGEALANLIQNTKQLQSCAVNVPFSGEKQRDIMEDICAFTGAEFVSQNLGFRVESLELTHMGSCDLAIMDEHSTRLIGGNGTKDQREARAENIRVHLKNSTDNEDKKFLQKRISSLIESSAIVRVGGVTHAEVKERLDRAEDALFAIRAAMQEGIVCGGGFALKTIHDDMTRSEELPHEIFNDPSMHDAVTGWNLVVNSLLAPSRQIIENGGLEYASIIMEVNKMGFDFGFDSDKSEVCKLIDRGIIDPVKVVRSALESAVSVSGTILSTECILGAPSLEDLMLMQQGIREIGSSSVAMLD